MSRGDLYPEIASRVSGFLDVGDRHEVYWEESGNPDGMPVIFLHGGPGSGTSPTQRRFFDPKAYRIVLMDQRGAGRSRPKAAMEANTTPHLVADLERLRDHLGVDAWLVFGGSWGSTLALAYGQAHPERCLGFILRGMFLGRPSEVDWFLHGIATVFPEEARRFEAALPEAERTTLLPSYLKRLSNPDPAVHLPAARAWARYEAACSSLIQDRRNISDTEDDDHALGLARLEAHYFKNDLFLRPDGLLAAIDRIKSLPATIVQGRYDMICPPRSADDLAQAWPGAELVMVPDAGHAAMEPGIRRALVKATDRLKTKFVSALPRRAHGE